MDLSGVGGEICYYEDSRKIVIIYENYLVELQRAPTPDIKDIIEEEEEEKEGDQISSSQNF